MFAHDAVRYVGDMLAWIHQAVASESELVQILLEGAHDEGKNKSVHFDFYLFDCCFCSHLLLWCRSFFARQAVEWCV
jgi:hypothetical protein